MKTTIFPREEHTQTLFREILKNPSACERLQDTFCEYLNNNEEIGEDSFPGFCRGTVSGIHQSGSVRFSDDHLSEYYI